MTILFCSSLLGVAVIIGSGLILSASWHDLRTTARRSRLKAAQRRLQRSRQPRVAVLIDASGASLGALAACLSSVIKSHYHEFTICVIDNHHSTALKRFVQTYSRLHAGKSVRYYTPRRPLLQEDLFHGAYRRLRKHDFLILLDTSDTISPNIIKQSAAHFTENEHLGMLRLARRSRLSLSLSSLLMRYGEISDEITQKAVPHLRNKKPPHAATGIMYRHGYFEANSQNAARDTRYDSSLIITTHRANPIKAPRHPLFVWLLSATCAYLLTYISVMATTLQSSSLLLLTWISICAWTIVALWTEVAVPIREKLTLSYAILLSPLLLYARLIWLTAVLPLYGLRGRMRQWHRTRHNTNRYGYQRYVLDNILTFKAWYEEMCPREVWYQDQRRTDD